MKLYMLGQRNLPRSGVISTHVLRQMNFENWWAVFENLLVIEYSLQLYPPQ